jgi:hypothetical protein
MRRIGLPTIGNPSPREKQFVAIRPIRFSDAVGWRWQASAGPMA